MRYEEIKEFDINNGEGIRVSLWVCGCEFKCKNCHNRSLWDRNEGIAFDRKAKDYLFEVMDKDIPKSLSILGGEPMTSYNRFAVLQLCKDFKRLFPNRTIWLWSGYTKEHIERILPEIFPYIDVLIDGLFIEELKDESLEWRGSSNQRIHYIR